MTFRKLAAASAAMALAATPVLASAAPADIDRGTAPVAGESDLGGGSSFLLILALVAFGAGIFLLADNDDDTPDSP